MPLELTHEHHLEPSEARARVEALVRDLAAQVQATYRWEGNTLVFVRTGLEGRVEVTERLLRLRLERRAWLPVPEAWLRQQIVTELHRHFPPANASPAPPPPASQPDAPVADLAAALLQGNVEGFTRHLLSGVRRFFGLP